MKAAISQVLDGSINRGKVFDLTTYLDHIADAYAVVGERRAIKALLRP
jgi:alcohol dehydrogenase